MFEGLNKNEDLWKLIDFCVQGLTQKFNSTYDNKDFQFDFQITQNCWQENESFINVGEITIPFNITYMKGRFDNKPREWKKYVGEIEKKLTPFFPNFKVPEQVFLAKSNPLTNSSPKPVLQMEKQESSVFDCPAFLQMVGKTTKNPFLDNLKFKLFINTDDVEFSITPKIGLNFIEDECVVKLEVKVQVYICSAVDYCKFVLNSNILSQSIYTEYLKKQFSAYTADSEYPSPQINIYKTFSYPFDLEENLDFNTFYLNEKDEIVFIPQPNLSFESYIKETLKGYDESKKEIVKPYTEISSIQNRIINVDTNTKNILFTDCLGKIDFISYSKFRKIKNLKTLTETVLNKPVKAFKDLIGILRSQNVRPVKEVNQTASLRSFLSCYDKEQLFAIYKGFVDINIPVGLKLVNRFPLFAFLFEDTIIDEKSDLENLSVNTTFQTIKTFPVALSNFIKSSRSCVALVDKSNLYTQVGLFYRLGVLLANNKVKKSFIVTKDTINAFNILKSETINPVILDRETLTELYRLFGDNLFKYFQGLKTNTPVIINPEVFEASDILGDVNCYLANKQIKRNYVLELLRNTGFDFGSACLDELSDEHFNVVMELCSGVPYLCFSTLSERKVENLKIFDPLLFVCSYQLLPCFQPNVSVSCYSVEQDTNEYNYYLKLLSEGNALFDKDKLVYNEMKEDSLSNFQFTDGLNQKCYGYSNLFLNYPDFESFDYKKTLPKNLSEILTSKKIQAIIKYLTVKYFGGVIEGELQKSRLGKTVILFSNKLLASYFENRLKEHFSDSNFANINTGVVCFSLDNVDEKFYSLSDFDEVIFYDYTFDRFTLKNVFEKLELMFSFSIVENLKISLFYNKTTTEESFMPTLLSVFKNYLSSILGLEIFPVDYSNVSTLKDYTQEIKSKMSEINFSLIQIRKAIENTTELRKQAILAHYGYSISDKDLLSISKASFNVVSDNSPRYLIPFKNFMNLNGWLAQEQNLNCLTPEGKFLSYTRPSISKICLTEIGYGEIANDTDKQDVVSIFGFKKSVFDSTHVFAGDKAPADVENIPLFIDPSLLSIQDSRPSSDNTNKSLEQVKINCNYINGFPCLFNTGSDFDLSVLGFNYFNNVFVLPVENSGELDTYLSQMKTFLNEKQVADIKSIYEQFIRNKNLIIPSNYDFLTTGNIPSTDFKIFPTIIGSEFYIFINGIFFQKQCYKVSKHVPLNMIQTFFYIKEQNLQGLKQELYRVMRSVDVLNAQDCLDFLSTKAPSFVPVKFEEQPKQQVVSASLKSVKPKKINPLF